jgi:hypothetical protein
MVYFPDGSRAGQVEPLKVSHRVLAAGDRVILAGFDRSEQREFGALRVATGTVIKTTSYDVIVERDGGIDSCIDDRGGPLLVNTVIDDEVDASAPEMNVEIAGVRLESDEHNCEGYLRYQRLDSAADSRATDDAVSFEGCAN